MKNSRQVTEQFMKMKYGEQQNALDELQLRMIDRGGEFDYDKVYPV